MNILTIIIIVVVLLLIAGLFAYLVRIVPQATSYVVERLVHIIPHGIREFMC